MVSATIFEAKTTLSDLVRKAQRGETVIITSGRERTPVARLQPIPAVTKKRLGARDTPGFRLNSGFFDPLSEEDLAIWNGEAE